MNRIPSSPPLISGLSNGEYRTIWSVMIPVYNCAEFLSDTLISVLSQELGEDIMQIEVIDDASTDANVEQIVKEIGKGRVGYFRQQENRGSLRNFETCINRSKGHLIHLLHGDDRVKKGFYDKISRLFTSNPAAGAAFCRYSAIDEEGKKLYDSKVIQQEEGILMSSLLKIASEQNIQYAAMVVKREVYEQVGSFYGVNYGEDWEMWVRIAKHYPVAHSPEVLAEYRKHKGSISWPKKEDGQTTKDLAYVIKLIEQHLPSVNKNIMASAKRNCALFCLTKANVIWGETSNRRKAETLVKLALSLDKSPKLFYHILKFYIKVALKINT
ncbi:glycosyltransferase family 2 protein [Cyclobacterium jeungdonense]|uniref:Glycosyltransferase n=1 Tax=Cyclobacterium jeungdonense TaxID=708087 RepID=A0ABT8CAR6_9BACT|nr:glycosyltransferase [Cyclobacterium jeungdonense]MDN3688860.1 glycosyltransferase [Cyclobacterium jeungdonense]